MSIKRFGITAVMIALLSPTLVAAAVSDATLVKSNESASVYYVTQGKRYAFPNEKVYFTWYSGFSNVVTISASELASYQLAGNVTYRPGSRLVKIMTDPKVYAVDRYGELRWVTTEALARTLYGTDWNTKVHDLSDAFFINYTVGASITASGDFDTAQTGVTRVGLNIRGIIENVVTTRTTIAGCPVFEADNAWNQDVSNFPVHPQSAAYISSIGSTKKLHPDFGENQDYGIPYNVVPGSQAKVPITWTAYGDESDPGPYPIPTNAKVESGSDRHVLVVDNGNCVLYELFNAEKSGNGWSADSGAVWNLNTYQSRPENWTSADAAGLPILPGLIRADEIDAGVITHAIRFTASRSYAGHILPATHHAGSSDTSLPPMGLRVRMKANYDISGLSGQARIIATAMKTYGMILADNGSSWYFQGATDPRWNDDELNQLKSVPGSAFEAVQTGEVRH